MQRSSNAARRDLNRVNCDKRYRNLRKRNYNARFQWFLTAGKFPNFESSFEQNLKNIEIGILYFSCKRLQNTYFSAVIEHTTS